jgi:endonuclease/exonuclease/phosphatase family metal-dependent hydrolase
MQKLSFLILISIIFLSCGQETLVETPDKEIVIGTFNIQWLGDGIDDNVQRNETEYKRIAQIIKETKADVLGLQEIENPAALQKLMIHLPDYDYKLGDDGWLLNLGVIYKKDVNIIEFGEYMPIIVKENRTRPGFYVTAKKGNFDWKMMVVHFKSTSRWDSTDKMREESYAMRRKQASALNTWVDSIITNTNEDDIILIGDFNDNPSKAGKNLQVLIDNDVTFLSEDLTSCKNVLWTSIDHVAVTPGAMKRYKKGSITTHNFYKALTEEEADKVSDHCPVLATFDLTLPDDD